jgi:hypothetical protein
MTDEGRRPGQPPRTTCGTAHADPANLQPSVPKVMRDAAELVRQHGSHLGKAQDDLVERLQAPYSPRILRAVREGLAQPGSSRQRIDHLAELADRLGLVRQPAPEPLPAIEEDDIRVMCWIAIIAQ